MSILGRTLARETLDRILQPIVEIAHPQAVILFGSAARDEMGPNSDVDLLVIKAGHYNRVDLVGAIYRALPGDEAVDVIMVTPDDVERYRDASSLVICPALKEDKVVYAA